MTKRVYKLKPDTEDLRDKVFRSTRFTTKTVLPKSVDLRFGCSPIVDQGELGSCTANAIASGLREYWEKQAGSLTLLSRLWLYWEERNLEGTVNEDSGAMIRDGMKVLQQMGCAPEVDWPYDITKFTLTPPPQATMDAVPFKISEYHRVLSLTTLKAALAEGYPVVLGISVYESFESEQVAQTGIIPLPKRGEKLLGGHAVLAVGYIDSGKTTGYVACRNSWGEGWGDKGYFYLPYSYFAKYVTDMWTGK
ncbi:C1 family peptidase [Desulfosporosinus sp. BG]|uniref:C1 family peptidase n=1 Tax=Desulfosporosinus sp. BG TaxID=1633135 RepID=UPI00083B5E07|nr:C1 family peptidase [Desulfosporosinus sp. BG]ODA41933.1 Cysteine protease [Desulfosporosinus sp. BG]